MKSVTRERQGMLEKRLWIHVPAEIHRATSLLIVNRAAICLQKLVFDGESEFLVQSASVVRRVQANVRDALGAKDIEHVREQSAGDSAPLPRRKGHEVHDVAFRPGKVGGAGCLAGAFILASLAKVFRVKEILPTYRLALLIALAFLIVAPMPLLAHLGHPERSFEIFFTPQLNSAMAMFSVWVKEAI